MGQGAVAGRRRHAAVRLVVHRRGGADRHRRPLHHAGFRRRGRPRRLGGVPRPAEAHPPAPAAERRDRRDRAERHRAGGRRRAHGACRARSARRVKELETRLGVRMPVYVLFTKADLIAGFTEFFDDLDRETARAGLGRRPSRWRSARRPDSPSVRRRVPGAGRRLDAAAVRPAAGRAQPGAARADRRVPAQVASLEAPLAAFLREAFGRLARRAGAAAARRLFHLRHAGGHADRPADRRAGARLRPRPARVPEPAAGAGPQLLPGRLLRDVIFGEAMLVSRAARRARGGGCCCGWRVCGVLLLVVVAAGAVLLWRIAGAGAARRSPRRRRRSRLRADRARPARSTRWPTPTCRGSCRCSIRRAPCPRAGPTAARRSRAGRCGFGLSQARQARRGRAARSTGTRSTTRCCRG